VSGDKAPKPGLGRRGYDTEVWVGLFVIAGILAVLFCLFTFTDSALFRGRYVVTTVVHDAGGIRRGDPVQMRGVNIGRIQRFLIVKEGVAIKLEIEGEFSIPSDSRVELTLGSLLGGMVANIIPGTSTTMLRRGDMIPGTTGREFTDAANDIARDTQAALNQVKAILSDTTARNIENGSGQLVELIKDLRRLTADERKELDQTLAALRRAAQGVEATATKPEIDAAIERVTSLSRRLDDTSVHIEAASKSMEAVLGRIERGEGTLGHLSTDNTLYENLNHAVTEVNSAAAELGKLAADIRKDPKKYVKLSLF
jgi:phospholipid/cholesterol/gamma-HCH transport system substrate-binding protein